MSMKITIDSREKARLVKPLVDKIVAGEQFKEVEVVYKGMKYGDYLLENEGVTLLIERKEIQDFVNSYAKGHLQEKLFHMRQIADRSMLLIEGHYTTKMGDPYIYTRWGKDLHAGMPIKTYSRFILGQLEKSNWVYFTNDLFETLVTAFYMLDYLPALKAPNPTVKCGSAKELLLQIPGVGSKKIQELQEKYTNPLEALADIETWSNKSIKDGLNKW